MFDTISILESLSIVILLIIIIEYEIDRRRLKKEIKRVYQNMEFVITAQLKRTFKYANIVRQKLSNELYMESLKKNTIVKEICNLFYEELSNRLK